MNMIDAINTRISRRTYLDTPIEPAKLALLQKEIDKANAESGLTITFLQDGAESFEGDKSYGMFEGVRSMLVLKGNEDLPNLKEKVGYYGEKLILLAENLELGSCWVGGTFDKESSVFEKSPDEQIICVVPLGNISPSNREEKLVRGRIHRHSKEINEMMQADRPLTETETEAMKLVQLAPTARNTQKVEFVFEGDEITAQVADDYRFDLVDLGICKLHFETGMKTLYPNGHFLFGNKEKFIKR